MTKSLTDEQALHAKRDLQTAPKMVIPTNKLRYTKIQRNLIFTH